MNKLSQQEDVYDALVENSDEDWLLGLIAFAVIEEQKIEWIKHQFENTGAKPTDEEITKWYEQQTKGTLIRAKDIAENQLEDHLNEVMYAVLEDYKQEVAEGAIINEIQNLKEFQEATKNIVIKEMKNSKAFWPQFGINVVGGVVSALLFAALLAVIAFFVITDSSPAQIGTELRKQMEPNQHVEE